jgi:hypothetical protein
MPFEHAKWVDEGYNGWDDTRTRLSSWLCWDHPTETIPSSRDTDEWMRWKSNAAFVNMRSRLQQRWVWWQSIKGGAFCRRHIQPPYDVGCVRMLMDYIIHNGGCCQCWCMKAGIVNLSSCALESNCLFDIVFNCWNSRPGFFLAFIYDGLRMLYNHSPGCPWLPQRDQSRLGTGTFRSCSRKLLGNLRCGLRWILKTVVISPSGTGSLALTGIRTSSSIEWWIFKWELFLPFWLSLSALFI